MIDKGRMKQDENSCCGRPVGQRSSVVNGSAHPVACSTLYSLQYLGNESLVWVYLQYASSEIIFRESSF